MAGRYDCLAGQLAVLMRAIDCLTCIVQASRTPLRKHFFMQTPHHTHTHVQARGAIHKQLAP